MILPSRVRLHLCLYPWCACGKLGNSFIFFSVLHTACTLGLEELADLSSAETSDKGQFRIWNTVAMLWTDFESSMHVFKYTSLTSDSLMKQFSACMKQAQGKPLSQAEPKKPYIQIVHGQSPVVTQASCGLDLKCSPQKGRHLQVSIFKHSSCLEWSNPDVLIIFQANRSLRAGSLIIKERPYAAVLLPPFYKSHCHHCMNILHAPIPWVTFSFLCSVPHELLVIKSCMYFPSCRCSSCTTVAFCSESCRQSSWDQYHKTECPFMDLFHSVSLLLLHLVFFDDILVLCCLLQVGVAHLALRIILCTPLEELFSKYLLLSSLLPWFLPHLQPQLNHNFLPIFQLTPMTITQTLVQTQMWFLDSHQRECTPWIISLCMNSCRMIHTCFQRTSSNIPWSEPIDHSSQICNNFMQDIQWMNIFPPYRLPRYFFIA